jgi:hypothetical protein
MVKSEKLRSLQFDRSYIKNTQKSLKAKHCIITSVGCV